MQNIALFLLVAASIGGVALPRHGRSTNEAMARALKTRFPAVRVIQGDAFELGRTLDAREVPPFAAVLSGLPLLNFPHSARKRLVEGALARSRRVAVSVPSVKVTVADTIGAGDSFSAALMARLDQHELLTKSAVATLKEPQVADALAYAAEAASITCSRPGADPPWLSELS